MNNLVIAKKEPLDKRNPNIPFEKDEWESWREHPLTQWFLDKFLQEAAQNAKQTFIDHAWGRREVDPIYHAALFEREKVFKEMQDIDYDNF